MPKISTQDQMDILNNWFGKYADVIAAERQDNRPQVYYIDDSWEKYGIYCGLCQMINDASLRSSNAFAVKHRQSVCAYCPLSVHRSAERGHGCIKLEADLAGEISCPMSKSDKTYESVVSLMYNIFHTKNFVSYKEIRSTLRARRTILKKYLQKHGWIFIPYRYTITGKRGE